LVSYEGYNIGVENFASDTAGNQTMNVGGVALTEAGNDSIVVGGKVSFSASSAFTVSSNDAADTVVTGTQTSALSAVGSVNIGTQQGATDALDVVDGALSYIDDLRANLGAIQNRLSSVVASSQATAQNVTAARSQVQDADFAAETANLSRAQVLQQAGTAMVAQANQLPQGVLALLR